MGLILSMVAQDFSSLLQPLALATLAGANVGKCSILWPIYAFLEGKKQTDRLSQPAS